jgi:hypothetical protein
MSAARMTHLWFDDAGAPHASAAAADLADAAAERDAWRDLAAFAVMERDAIARFCFRRLRRLERLDRLRRRHLRSLKQ